MVSWRGFMLCPSVGAGTGLVAGIFAVDFVVMLANLRVVMGLCVLMGPFEFTVFGRALPAAGAPRP
ncbi:hypothetical protein NicSoilB8_29610 [Arthrobacter sp. NicSoilB8]|nr:hypothetical protein NicSoilB8_29610 [Arthrobacter sp. NicSoilB8]